jgi:hypothetical protein
VKTLIDGAATNVASAPKNFFYGLGMPIRGALLGINHATNSDDWFENGRFLPVKYNRDQFIERGKAWCEKARGSDMDERRDALADANGREDGVKDMLAYRKRRCANVAWIVALMESDKIYPGGALRNDFYIPTQRDIPSRASWTMGAAALIARAQVLPPKDRGLKGCVVEGGLGLASMGTFNGSADSMDVAPAIQSAFDDELYDEDFTTNTPLTGIESSDHVLSSAKFIHSLSDNNSIIVQFPLSFASFALLSVILVAIGAWVYRRGLRGASPTGNIFLPRDMVKV